ncbi:MAG: SUMF1/EgtB/PvdO family nonheme iron enzyme [Synechococcus sp.]
MASNTKRTKVFISYSHRDSSALERLQVHLKPLERDGIVERWDDTKIRAGQDWKAEIDRALDEARVAILLVSADFLASDFIHDDELPPILLAQAREGLDVLPVILGHCRFKRSPLKKFQAVNSPSQPLLGLPTFEQDKIWVQLTNTVEDLLEQPSSAPPPLQTPPSKSNASPPKSSGLENFSEPLGNGVALEMIAIPGGGFWMGSPEREEGRDWYEEFDESLVDVEGPQHRVNLQPFWMGKYPVTQAQWMEVAALPKVKEELTPQPSHFFGLDRPVEQISWFEAVEFCDRLSQQTGKDYRLPSEAEWEYACRARTVTPFSFGPTISTDLANYNGNYIYGKGSKGEYREQTTPVGTFKANAFGLYGMHGNVWEWCADHWHANYEGAPPGGTPWIKGGDKNYRVLRGGSWDYGPQDCRSACRSWDFPGYRYRFYGFRVACSPA